MVVILLAPGFEEAEALVPADLMRRAGVEVVLTALRGREVTGGHGITVKADKPLSALDPERTEMVVLPGGLHGVESIAADRDAIKFIQSVYVFKGRVAAICAAPTLLGGLGLLEGRKAVCYPGMEDQLAGALPQVGRAVVEDGPFVTGEAAGSAFDFGLKLVEVLKGAEAAQAVRQAVHYRG